MIIGAGRRYRSAACRSIQFSGSGGCFEIPARQSVAVLALGAGACGELPAESNVVDLRVLGIKSEPAGFLINLDDLGSRRTRI